MYTLPTELFSTITSQLADIDLLKLSSSSNTLNAGLQTVSITSRFWKDRCSTLLGIQLRDQVVDWKRVYTDLSRSTSLRENVREGNVDTILILLEEVGVDPTVDNNYPILLASENGHAEVVRLLLEHGADPTTEDNWAIRIASENGHAEVVRLLLADPRVDPSEGDNYAV
jgi:hypothetical protein